VQITYPDAQMLSWLQSSEIVSLLRRSRALVFPSRCYETSGLVCAEALANGVPVIASSATAAADLIEHRANGAIFAPDDQQGLVESLRRVANAHVAARASEAAYRRYGAAPLTLERHVTRLVQLYNERFDQ
jgi:glycosyltransferase involved in cell wall biosynthesis